jgi:uncharacterized protein involved in type VI secretion and phage assembly
MSDSLFNLLTSHDSENSNRIAGVVTGVITNNQDPEGLGRVKVRFPWLSDSDESWWARVAAPMAGKERGLYFLPEVDDEVLVAFEQGDLRFPYVLGGLWNDPNKPPETNDDGKNNKRTIKSRSGMIIRLDDTEGSEKLEISDKNNKNSIVIDVANNTITITADADISIESKNGKLKLSGKGIELTSQAEVKVEAQSTMDLKASGSLKVKGATVDIN